MPLLMNKIDEMIRELCPEGVKRVKLGKVCEILNGYAFKSTKYDSKGIRVIRISDVKSGYIDNCDIKYYPLSEIDAFTNYILCENDIVMSLTGNCGRVAIISKNIMPCALNQRVAALRSKEQLIQNYLFYLLNSPIFEAKAMENANGAGQKNLSTTWLANIEIPLPPLAIQQEIVSILDSFSSLQSKLEEELAVRQKQMEFYREKLLTFDENDSSVKWMKLGEVCEIYGRIGFRGYTRDDQVSVGKGALALSPSNLVDGKMDFANCTYISWMKYEESPEIMTFVGDVLFCKTGSTVGKVAYVSELPCKSTINPQLVVLKRIKVSPKYLYYYLSSNVIQRQVKSLAGVGSVPNISQSKLQLLNIPVSGKMQEIVSVLDTMSSLIDKLRQEIEQRRKQYEYYREKLLSFD